MSHLIKLSGLLYALITIIVLIIQSESIADAASAGSTLNEIGRQVPVRLNRLALTSTDWTTFKKTFNKHYSSVTQMMVRQKLFMARLNEVLITNLKHYLGLLSYYTVINKYSDATKEEIEMLTEGDMTQLGEKDFTDDRTAERILSSAIDTSRSREKRGASYDDDDDDDIWSSHPRRVFNAPEQGLRSISQETGREAGSSRLKSTAGLVSRSRAVSRVQSIVDGWLHQKQPDDSHKQVTVRVDWRETGCIGMPRDQGYCESCYAFSNMAFAEWAYCRHQAGKFTRLSPQYVINCGRHFNPDEFFGCYRGTSKLVPDFIRDYGLELDANVPYVEKTQECHVDESVPKERWGSIRPIVEPSIRLKNNTSKLDKAIGLRPVIVSMFVPQSFVGYGGGSIDDCTPALGGHAVIIVASISEDGTDYLIAQNSLGPFWGLKGYFKIKRTPEFFHKCIKHILVPSLKFGPRP